LSFEPRSESEIDGDIKAVSDDFAQSFGNAIGLVPVAFLILFVAVCASMLKGLGGRP